MKSPSAILGAEYGGAVLPLILNARESIRIIVYDWRRYPTISGSAISKFNSAILSAGARGVSVRALVNNDAIADWLKGQRCQSRRLHSKRLLHTKMLLIDNTKLVIGSHNYTQGGFSLNHEASIFVELPSADNDFVKYFESLWGL